MINQTENQQNIIDVSATLIEFANENHKKITNFHLQKLLYLTQLEYMKKYNLVLFEEEFQAWTYGPVNYNIWKIYSEYSRTNISKVKIGKKLNNKNLNFILEKK